MHILYITLFFTFNNYIVYIVSYLSSILSINLFVYIYFLFYLLLYMIELFLDTKEPDQVFNAFVDQNIQIVRANMLVGDILIRLNDKDTIIIERKTASDFASSINDGRYAEQKTRMKAIDPSIQLVYLIEGLTHTFVPFKAQRINYDIMFSAMASIVVKDKIYLFRTADLKETVLFVKKIVEKMTKNPELFGTDRRKIDYSDKIKINKKDNIDPKNCYLMQLSCIPGLSMLIAKEIAKIYPNLSSLLQHYSQLDTIEKKKSMLENIMCNKRKLGPKLSERIYTFLCTE